MHWNRILAAGCAVLFACSAWAEEKAYTYEVKLEDGPPACGQTQQGDATKKGALRIEVMLPEGATLESASLVKAGTPPTKIPFPEASISHPAGESRLAVLTLERAKFGDLAPAHLQLQVKTGGTGSKLLDCKTEAGDSVAYFAAEDKGTSSSTSTSTRFDGMALEDWLENGPALRDALLEKLKALDGKKRLLFVHLPSGAVAPPMDNSVSEGEWIQVAFLLPQNEELVPKVTAKNCEAVNTFRQKEEAAADKGGKQAGEEPGALSNREKVRFKLVPVEQMFRCGAGTLSYEVHPLPAYAAGGRKEAATGTTDADSASTDGVFKTRVRPRYHLAATAMLGFDTATHRRFEADQSDVIQEVKNREGLAVYVGAVWMMGGVDYEDMEWNNYFLNLFAAVKPTSPTEDAVVGLALTPTGSLSLAVGLSLHKDVRLTKGYSVGASFTGDGDIPTEKTWKGVRPGLFLGLAVDSNIFDALSKRFQPAKQ